MDLRAATTTLRKLLTGSLNRRPKIHHGWKFFEYGDGSMDDFNAWKKQGSFATVSWTDVEARRGLNLGSETLAKG